ncbi:GL13475 [Drosophila persimilis]|uniref:Zinc transporter ZIP13 homolog n=2 Tax=pseudoobscura subgroup TaxID=32358 RepID=A0A6I8VD30_DROPS|nr:zinc transporter ZIP13 homolog [Drosophila pseudoobscura]XP_002020510.1 zinc transporter ZIP13 homolog [Drosophila persimilis]XP_003736224.1 zinc transporter ZIP13 homolog [Drosophila pseudoobscura]XP_015038738.1 zinc transporter ZIP13 homolog [Drosophila pseudoobscura]XP_026841947.1 zinc transporter ZIP13 homolog [Drosophila persimilis]XP_033240548.1 zinc transporter ZIP13 homolog [Drosophila pseudoobscura]EDW39322.1 GL13475 [Drosophila persimilis]
MSTNSSFFDEHLTMLYANLMNNYVPEYFKSFQYTPWVFSLLGSVVIGLSGIFPLLIIPSEEKLAKNGYKDPAESKFLRVLLSFAVGGLLGDVFLHLLPEAWEGDHQSSSGELGDSHPSLRSGLWVLAGILIFTIVEKIFSGYTNADEENPQPKCVEIANCLLRRHGGKLPEGGTSESCGGACDIEDVDKVCFLREREQKSKEQKEQPRKVAGYLNLLANSIDNFTHGLAVAGSFLVSFRHGVLATFAILLHEIPHEVGDFAILLRSGFSRWDAARAQLLTAGAGLLGALVAIGGSGVTSAMEARTSWIMPFTAGGFLHISLVTVLPDLLKEEERKESIKQLLALVFGIALMAVMTTLFEH